MALLDLQAMENEVPQYDGNISDLSLTLCLATSGISLLLCSPSW